MAAPATFWRKLSASPMPHAQVGEKNPSKGMRSHSCDLIVPDRMARFRTMSRENPSQGPIVVTDDPSASNASRLKSGLWRLRSSMRWKRISAASSSPLAFSSKTDRAGGAWAVICSQPKSRGIIREYDKASLRGDDSAAYARQLRVDSLRVRSIRENGQDKSAQGHTGPARPNLPVADKRERYRHPF